MTLQNFQKFSMPAVALLAALALPVGIYAQTAPAKAIAHGRKIVSRANTIKAEAQSAVQSAPSAQTAQETTPAVSPTADQTTPVVAANGPVQPAVPATPSTNRSAASDPVSQVQNGVNQVNDKKQKAKSIWRQLKGIRK